MIKIPGIFSHMDDVFSTKFYEEPPEGCHVEYGNYDGAVFPNEKMLYDIGIDKICDNFDMSVNHMQSMNFDLGYVSRSLNKNQGYYLLCNIMWAAKELVGMKIDSSLKVKMKSIVRNVLKYLSSIETSPGQFGQECDPDKKLRAADFGLEEYE
jgi:hypothetical protein